MIIGSGAGECSSNATNCRRNRRCALSATDTRKPEEKDARGVTCFMEENVISPREVARFKFEVGKEEQYFAYV